MKEGKVIKSTGSWYMVRSENKIWDCRIKGRIRLDGIKSTNPVAVGDVVDFHPEEGQESRGVIAGIHDRKNYIVRKSVNLSKRTHVIAANLDQAILIATLEFPKTYPRFIDRFMVTAEAYDIPGVLIFNKHDLYTEEMLAELDFLSMVYRDAGYTVVHTSLVSGTGLDEFRNLLKDHTSLLSGHSGVGKSSLINHVEPGLDLKTKKISESHLQGQHTTTFAEMHALSFGGDIIDTPGIRGFGLVDMDKEEIGDYFPEIFRLKGGCRFHNCLHVEEPGCAVKEAVENARLPLSRYESYVALVQGLDEDDTYRADIYE